MNKQTEALEVAKQTLKELNGHTLRTTTHDIRIDVIDVIRIIDEALEQKEPVIAIDTSQEYVEKQVENVHKPAQYNPEWNKLSDEELFKQFGVTRMRFEEQPAQEPLTRAQQIIRANNESIERSSNMVAVPLDKLQDMQKRLSDCEEYLKEGETPAECIARNRHDTSTTLKMLAKCMGEKEALEGISKMETTTSTIKESLKVEPAQEPVAVIENYNDTPTSTTKSFTIRKRVRLLDHVENLPLGNLYTHPAPAWQGLSDDEIKEIIKNLHSPYAQIRTAEIMLKEKNGFI